MVVPVLAEIAHCRLCVGSPSSAMLAVQEALGIDPDNDAVRTLKGCLINLQTLQEAFRQERAAGRWRAARSIYASCVKFYEEADCPVPIELVCWEVDLAIFERDWDKARGILE